MKTSLIEFICWPLKWIIKRFGYDIRQPYVYEHVLTPFVFIAVTPLRFQFAMLISILLIHVVLKELIVDQITNGYLNKENLIERLYGYFISVGLALLKTIIF